MTFRLNLQGNLPQPKAEKPEQPTIEELIKDMPNLKELEAADKARMNSIIEGINSFAAEKFKFNSGNSVFTDSANLKNDMTEK